MFSYRQSFLYIGILLKFYSECSSIINNVGNDFVVGEKGKDITLTWKMFDIGERHTLAFFFNKIEKTNSLGSSLTTFNQSISLSNTKRISSGSCYFPNNNGTCNITLSNLKYNDSGLYIAAEYIGHILQTFKNVSLEVKGGPDFCGTEQQNFTYISGQTISGNVTVCGNPKPGMNWYIDEVIKGAARGKVIHDITVDESLKDQHQYTCSFQLKTNSRMCGLKISFWTTGFQKLRVIPYIPLLLKKFAVSDIHFTETVDCPTLTWRAEDHGLCEVDMVLSFIKSDNSTINVTVPVANEIVNDCQYTWNSTGVTYQTIVYWNRIQTSVNKDSNYVPLWRTTTNTTITNTSTTITTITPTLPPTNTIPATTSSTTTNSTTGTKTVSTNDTGNVSNPPSQCSCTQVSVKVVGALIGGMVFGIVSTTIVFIVWLRKGGKKEDFSHNELEVREQNNAADEVMLTNRHVVSNDGVDTYSTLTTTFDARNSTYTDLVEEKTSYGDIDIVPQDYEVKEDD